MIDTAIPDLVADGLINFDKRRKEFEVLAQVSYFVRMGVFCFQGLECHKKDWTVLLQSFIRKERDFIMTTSIYVDVSCFVKILSKTCKG